VGILELVLLSTPWTNAELLCWRVYCIGKSTMGWFTSKVSRSEIMWPEDIGTIECRGGITTTEIWWVKERIEDKQLIPVKRPEKTLSDKGQYYTIYSGEELDTYAVLTKGDPEAGDMWCLVIAINKLTPEQASKLLSCYPYRRKKR